MFSDSESLKAIVSAAAAVVALISVFTTFWLSQKKETRELFDMQVKYFEGFRKWADASADALTEAIHLCDLDPDKTEGEPFFNRRHRLLVTISNQIDKGRWFFPNIEGDGFGSDKESGFQGYRHEVLDGLVSAYRLLQIMSYRDRTENHSIRGHIAVAKRNFVGCVQKILDPAGQQVEFRRIARRRVSHLSRYYIF